MKRRSLIRWIPAAALAPAGAAFAQGATPVTRLVLGFAPGGSTDILARHLADQMKAPLARTIVVENKTGASGRLALEAVKLSPPDGDTLLLAPHGAMTLFPHIYKSLKYDPAKDFTPLTRVSLTDYALAVSAASPARDVAGFKAWAKAQGDNFAYGSPGAGTVLHFLGIRIAKGLGITMTHIPYRGASPALTDLLGGAVQAVVAPLADMVEMAKAGRIRVIATAASARTKVLDGVPTLKESGLDLDVPAWTALYGPAGMAPAVRDRVHAAAVQALRHPALQERMGAMGFSAIPNAPAELAALQRAESAEWAAVVKASGFTPED